jgi:hypothetical protein
MSTQVPTSFVQQYRDNFIMLSQQRGSKLRAYVRDDPDQLIGKAGYFDRIGATAMQRRTSRHQDTPLVSTPHSRRRLTLEDYVWADLIDKADRAKMAANPENSYMTNAVWAAGRQFDAQIYAALGGSSYSMNEDDAATAVVLPSAQKVVVANHTYDAGSGDVGLTVGKCIAARDIIMGADAVDEDDVLYIVANSKQISNMLAETEVSSRDYNDVYALKTGKVDTFMGFKFIMYNNLSVDGSADQLVYAWHPSGIGLGVGMDIGIEMDVRPDKNYSTQVFVDMSIGATRIEEAKVVEIACDPS